VVSELAATVYWGGMLVLFFFWVYGLVSFLLDLKNTILPGIVQYRRGRRRLDAERDAEAEREERERELY